MRLLKTKNLELYAAVEGSLDEFMPVNGMTVRLKNEQGEIVGTYVTDQNYNGIFVFNDLEPGRYYIELKGEGFATRQGKVNPVQVNAGTTCYKSIYASRGTSTPFDDEVAIDNVQSDEQPSAIYDLSGRRVEKIQKGFYIQNGKKVLK